MTTESEMSMVERVARAISESFREEGAFWDGHWASESERSAFHNSTRNAICALRELTPAMLDAARAVPEEVLYPGHEQLLVQGLCPIMWDRSGTEALKDNNP